jgi:hypothetical protein
MTARPGWLRGSLDNVVAPRPSTGENITRIALRWITAPFATSSPSRSASRSRAAAACCAGSLQSTRRTMRAAANRAGRGAPGAGRFRDRRSRAGYEEAPAAPGARIARRFGRPVSCASRRFNSALARCSFDAAASTSLRLVAASSSASASRSCLVQYSRSSMRAIVHTNTRETKMAAVQPSHSRDALPKGNFSADPRVFRLCVTTITTGPRWAASWWNGL